MALTNYYFALKRGGADRTRIGHVPLPDNMTDAELTTFIANLEALTKANGGAATTADAAVVIGATQAVKDIQAADEIAEAQDLVNNPMGMDGYLSWKDPANPKDKYQQPFTLKGIDKEPTAPVGYEGEDATELAIQFLLKWAKVLRRGAGGALEGETPQSVQVTSRYSMH